MRAYVRRLHSRWLVMMNRDRSRLAALLLLLMAAFATPGCTDRTGSGFEPEEEIGDTHREDDASELEEPGRVGEGRDLDCSGLSFSDCEKRKSGSED